MQRLREHNHSVPSETAPAAGVRGMRWCLLPTAPAATTLRHVLRMDTRCGGHFRRGGCASGDAMTTSLEQVCEALAFVPEAEAAP